MRYDNDFDFVEEIFKLMDIPIEPPKAFKAYNYERLLQPTQVIFNDPATIVMWDDGSKTVIKCQPGDKFDKEKGLAMAYVKRFHNNKGEFNEVFKKWIGGEY